MSTSTKDNAMAIVGSIYSEILDNMIDNMSNYAYLGFDGALITVLSTVQRKLNERKEMLNDPHVDDFTKEAIKRELELFKTKLSQFNA